MGNISEVTYCIGGFEWVEETSKKSYSENSYTEYSLEVDVQYPNLHELHNYLPFNRKNENWKGWKTFSRLVWRLKVIPKRNLEQALNYGLVFKERIASLNSIKKLG